MNYTQLLEDFTRKRIMIVGDIMIDSYMFGQVDRISPEAPVPVVAINHTEDRLGGAANVALNIRALDANVVICSIIGKDKQGETMKRLFAEAGVDTAGLVESESRITTVKTRIIGNNVQMLRVDEEQIHPVNTSEAQAFIAVCNQLLDNGKIDAIIFQDYDKGCLTPEIIKAVTDKANSLNIPVCVDPKKRNFLEYKNVTLFKPNLKELKEGVKIDFNKKDTPALKSAMENLQKANNIQMVMTTLSELGVSIQHEKGFDIFPAHLRKIADVSGAGDTVISVAALCLACQCSPQAIAQISNLAGGLVCEHVGVVPIEKSQFLEELKLNC